MTTQTSDQLEPVASFGKRGELRHKVGETGRVHLDRWLPFLVLHRSTDPQASIARRVAVNSPAYLIWSPADDAAAAQALEATVAELSERLGSVLLILVDDAPSEPQAADSPQLASFAIGAGADGGGRAREALDAFVQAAEKIEIELRRPELTVAPAAFRPPLAVDAHPDWLSVSIPQIHRAPDGRIYPQITHELALGLGDALLRAAAAFMDAGQGAPAHHRSLGRSAFLAAALHADRKLDAIARSFDFLLSVSPINTAEAMHCFFEDESRPPEFRYRPLTIAPDDSKRDLYSIDLSLLEDPLLERLLCEKRRELDTQLTLLATRNTPAFRAASQLLYGAVSRPLLDEAHAVLDGHPPLAGAPATLPASRMAAAAQKLIDRYRARDPRFDAVVEVRDDIAGMLVSGPKLMIGSSSSAAEDRIDALLAHEVSVHLLTYFNGAAQGLSIFRTGLASYEGVQEGLGVFAEWAVGGLTTTRLRLLAARVIAVDAMLHGAGFLDVYRLLGRDLGFSKRSAFNVSARVFRSGGLAKDAIYLKGFRDVLNLVAAGASLGPFWAGKIAVRHIDAVEELLLRGLLHAPPFTPEFLDRPDAQRRIARVRDGLAFNQILSPE